MPDNGAQEMSPLFVALNRGKKSVTLDLRNVADHRAFPGIVATADALIEGFRSNVVKRLGLDFDALLQVNPRLVCVSVTGYGQDGPGYAGLDLSHDRSAPKLGEHDRAILDSVGIGV
jgi:crotonobetainyl-CoA:carnitine CoA-transferase CaiB-like acyl-CoA transferase